MPGKRIVLMLFTLIVLMLPVNVQYAQNKEISLAFSLKEKDLIPEGIIYDTKEKVFYIGSINKQKIIKARETGSAEEFKKQKEEGLYSVLGMTIDRKRRELWVCSYAAAGSGAEEGCAGIFKYDLKDGRLIKKYLLDNKNAKHLFNDIAVTKAGDAYFTDSEDNSVYFIDHNKDVIEPFAAAKKFSGPNGITLSPGGRYLFVADSAGIHRVDLNGNRIKLKQPDEISSGGCDGIYFYNNSIVAVQNDFTPQRVARFYLNRELDKIEKIKILCQDNPLVFIPTTGVIVGNGFYIIGNSQLNLLKEGKITDCRKLEETRIIKIKL
jgi:hypothetical protein